MHSLLWELTWVNYMLMLASIELPEDEKSQPLKVVDAKEAF